MQRFLSTTAVLLTMSGAAYADAHATGFGSVSAETGDFYASNLIGMRIYNSETEVGDDMTIADGGETEWDDLGEVNDVLISQDGDVKAVILGIGGFLGLGERDVSVSMDAIKVVREEGDSDDRFLVVNTSKEMLEQAPAFERVDATMTEENVENTAENVAETTEQTAENVAETTEQTAEAAVAETDEAITAAERPLLARPAVEREGYAEAQMEEVQKLTAEDLEGSYVYGANDETVGEIGSLLMADDGKVSQVVINVGGFLGLGEKPVAVSWDELQVLKNVDGGDVRIYIDSTEEALEALPEYEQ